LDEAHCAAAFWNALMVVRKSRRLVAAIGELWFAARKMTIVSKSAIYILTLSGTTFGSIALRG
jgi:hypothetical protein